MTKLYRLQSNMSDRGRFDEWVERYCDTMLDAIEINEALQFTPEEYRAVSLEVIKFSQLEPVEMENPDDMDAYLVQDDTVVYVDDVEEAQSRYNGVFEAEFTARLTQKIKDDLDEELYLKDTGFVTYVECVPPMNESNAITCTVVVLDADGDVIAYRVESDSYNNDWQIGDTGDVAKEVVDRARVQKNEDDLDNLIVQYEQDLDDALDGMYENTLRRRL